MQRFLGKSLFFFGSLTACTILALTTGCASGGFKLTRQYAGWVNSQTVILRVIIYILTGIVFAVTLLIDMVVFNTMDFWQGHVSAGSFDFKDGEKTYQVKHEYLPGTQLRQSTIVVRDRDMNIAQEVQLTELTTGDIEMRVDGKLRARVKGLSGLPIAEVFGDRGQIVKEEVVPFAPLVIRQKAFARN